MTLEITDERLIRPKNAIQDWTVLLLIAAGFIASWVYLFLHPSAGAFGVCVGGTGAWSVAFHWIVTRDDKEPDRREG
jgi:membrane associated rhomboid family serine protease